MSRFPLLLPLVIFFGIATASHADQALCVSHDDLARILKDRFGETLSHAGLGKKKHRVEVYQSDETGRWTLAAIRPDGVACVLSTGQGPAPMLMS